MRPKDNKGEGPGEAALGSEMKRLKLLPGSNCWRENWDFYSGGDKHQLMT